VKVLEIRSNIFRVMTIVDEQLGLRIATLGWSCVWISLSVSLPSFLMPSNI